ncbi:hypothetical protein J3Q64DRAFT_1697067 [Phycomyces blakesleeanus]|uniref:Uncharacterized protein n=1 Tax=Phycomyces blakesleeanus TaxID=4837 RepID=A0ABR3B2Z7_PHYBL
MCDSVTAKLQSSILYARLWGYMSNLRMFGYLKAKFLIPDTYVSLKIIQGVFKLDNWDNMTGYAFSRILSVWCLRSMEKGNKYCNGNKNLEGDFRNGHCDDEMFNPQILIIIVFISLLYCHICKLTIERLV